MKAEVDSKERLKAIMFADVPDFSVDLTDLSELAIFRADRCSGTLPHLPESVFAISIYESSSDINWASVVANADLTQLRIGQCGLSSVDKSVAKLDELQFLCLPGNKFTEIPVNALPAKLDLLDMSWNQIGGKIPVGLDTHNLSVLSLIGNKIRFISSKSLSNRSIKAIYLSHNELKFVPNYFTTWISEKSAVDLRDNPITEAYLEEAVLEVGDDCRPILYDSGEDAYDASYKQYADLRNNQITELGEDWFGNDRKTYYNPLILI